jgi:hypothetical protein
MPRKRDTASERLRQHAKKQTDPLARALGLVNDPALLGVAFSAEAKFSNADWDDAETRAAAASHALSIDDQDIAIKKAFETFALDPKNPFHWRKLIAYFADVHFGESQKGPGAPKVWSDRRLCQLLADFHYIKSRRTRLAGSGADSDLAICKILQNDPRRGAAYPPELSPKTICRKLQDARDPNRNGLLGTVVADVMASFEAKLNRLKPPLQRRLQKMIRKAAVSSAVISISTQWNRVEPSAVAPDLAEIAKAQRRAGIGT